MDISCIQAYALSLEDHERQQRADRDRDKDQHKRGKFQGPHYDRFTYSGPGQSSRASNSQHRGDSSQARPSVTRCDQCGKTIVVADALSRKSMGSLLHVDAEKKELTKELHQLASFGVRLMDSDDGLPRSYCKFDSIWVVIDRLTKSAHFLPVKTTYTAEDSEKMYVKEIVRLHGISLSIISDRGAQFTANFWRSF
ncbi:uncharacterized protein LOC132032157 [Lycium ferocissimum]|uniref:uncharacterized protein LOC132032157 n=1 Tax=Lycium ferocissimum TaxID=112874 RepID=UPI00281593CF|nr:uncharacterized protein LOC132032157 [Lycium ferocissimum]